MIPLDRIQPWQATRDLPSPNHGSRSGEPIRLILLHATADKGSEAGAESWMRNPASNVSAHLHIRRDGSVTRLVDDHQRAWHAGRSSWPGIADVNASSLGWEIANRNDGIEPYTAAQYATVGRLLAHYLPQGLTRDDVGSHAQAAPGRKTDPLGWDWRRMWREYLAIPEPSGELAVEPPAVPAVNLDRMIAFTPADMQELARVRRLDPDQMLPYLRAFEAGLRIMSRNGVKHAKQAADIAALGIHLAEGDE